jgi:diguanylate cyclase (GGDEF)-like protein/PAS domain S-box-containing protein
MPANSYDSLKIDLIKSLDFFKGLESEVIESLAHDCEEILLNPEEILFEEGEPGDAMFLILYGNLSIERQNIVIAKRVKGEYVGEMALIESAPRAATVTTHTKTHLLKITKEQFQSYFTSNRQTLLEILKTISERYRTDLAALDKSAENLKTQRKITSRLQDLLNDTSSEIYTLDPSTLHFTHMNNPALKNLKYKLNEIVQLKPMDIILDIDPSEFEEWIKLLQSKKRNVVQFKAIHRRSNGSFYPVKTQLKLDSTESSSVIVGIVQDVSELKDIESKFKQLSFYDPLTALPNRTLIIDQLSSVTLKASIEKKIISVLLIDLQNFNTISNSLGQMVCDLLLVAVARRLEKVSPPHSIVGRGRDNEFITILSQSENHSNPEEFALFLLDSFKTPFSIEGQDIFVNLGIGISSFPANGKSAETLIRQAATAARHLSQEGESTYCHYKPDMPFVLKNRLLLEGDLRKGLERNEFELYYQPKLTLESETITGFEALVRWNHPEKGKLIPVDFISVAEDSDIIITLGEWVLKTACRQMNSWLNKGLPVKNIAVNLSGRQFKQADLVSNIEKIVLDSGIQPESLELEITETILMENLDTVTVKLREISDMGVKLSLDDFGTGYSSLRYLNSFPLNNIKIDQTFIKDISTEENATIAKAIVSLAKSFQLKTIAEGVETKNQKNIMKAIGCDFIQGYLIGKPIPAEEVIKLFAPV